MPEKQRKSLGFMYVGTRPCGCVSAMAWDDAGHEKSTGALVARVIKRGDSVNRIERFEDDELPTQKCSDHATSGEHIAAPTAPIGSSQISAGAA